MMELEMHENFTVDPEVRAHIYSLVSALGGTGADENGRYILGDEALACLKDLKKWLKMYDEKANRLDVARCLAEANVVEGDLLLILAAWPESATSDRVKSKIALACMELLVPLTWPVDKNDMQMTVNHHRHLPYLQLAQFAYKRAILEHDSGRILRAAVRTGIPSIAMPMGDRSPRDEGIIKLLLYFIRNVLMIDAPRNLPIDDQGVEISRSSAIEALHRQDVLALLLTVNSNIGEDFTTQDTVMIEVLFHLVKGVNVEKLFMDKRQLNDKNNHELKSLLSQEANMHRAYAKTAPTRHNRFGTMIWVQREGAGRHSTVSGQDILKDGQKTLMKMDQTKRWNKPKQHIKDQELNPERFDMPVSLTESARLHLRSFVEEFLDSGFNPLFNSVRRAIEREAGRVLEAHQQQYFYLVSWFLEAERIRRKRQAERRKLDHKLGETFEPDSFGLVSTVLIQEFFVMLNRYMQNALDMKSWRELHAGIRCFTQILLLVQDMAESPLEEDQEIAENIQNRIFYEETTHDRIIAILRGFKDQGFGYLDACTELAHVFLRMLEHYSRENADLQIRSKRRSRKARKSTDRPAEPDDDDEDQGSEVDDRKEAEKVSKERKFDFARFAAKFMTQACIDTFVVFTRYYNDLNPDQLKRAHRFFYRVAFKQEQSVMLFRLDIIALFNKMMKGPEGLDTKTAMYREWDELIRQVIKRLGKKLEQRPELAVEMLFSKIPSTAFYLEYGYEKQTNASTPRTAAELEVRGDLPLDEQIGIVVAALFEEHLAKIQWVSRKLASAADERQSWEGQAASREEQVTYESDNDRDGNHIEPQTAVKDAPLIVLVPEDEELRLAILRNGKLRLLMTLSGINMPSDDNESLTNSWLPSSITSSELRRTHKIIESHCQNPMTEYGEGAVPIEEMLRRKPAGPSRRADFDDDSENDGIVSDGQDGEDFLFPAGGPTDTVARHKSALDALKKKRRKRRSDSGSSGLDEVLREARRESRKAADLIRRRGIKSEQFVHDSDDDSDPERDQEFFEQEAARRLGQKERVAAVLAAGRVVRSPASDRDEPTISQHRKRKANATNRVSKKPKPDKKFSDEEDDRIDMSDAASSISIPSSIHRGLTADLLGTSDPEDDDEEDTPSSSPPNVDLKQDPVFDTSRGQESDSSQTDGGGELSDSANDDSNMRDRKQRSLPQVESGVEGDDPDTESFPVARRRVRVAVFDDSDDE